jgi:hypothetical protein
MIWYVPSFKTSFFPRGSLAADVWFCSGFGSWEEPDTA